MAVRSTRLASAKQVVSGFHDVYTVPASHVVILKSVVVHNPTGGGLSWSVGGKDPAGTLLVDFVGDYSPGTLPSLTSKSFEGWWALDAGCKLYVHTYSTDELDFWLSGALLS